MESFVQENFCAKCRSYAMRTSRHDAIWCQANSRGLFPGVSDSIFVGYTLVSSDQVECRQSNSNFQVDAFFSCQVRSMQGSAWQVNSTPLPPKTVQVDKGQTHPNEKKEEIGDSLFFPTNKYEFLAQQFPLDLGLRI